MYVLDWVHCGLLDLALSDMLYKNLWTNCRMSTHDYSSFLCFLPDIRVVVSYFIKHPSASLLHIPVKFSFYINCHCWEYFFAHFNDHLKRSLANLGNFIWNSIHDYSKATREQSLLLYMTTYLRLWSKWNFINNFLYGLFSKMPIRCKYFFNNLHSKYWNKGFSQLHIFFS